MRFMAVFSFAILLMLHSTNEPFFSANLLICMKISSGKNLLVLIEAGIQQAPVLELH